MARCFLGASLLVVVEAEARECGVVGRASNPLGCHHEATTDCPGLSQLQGACPSNCPFVAPHSYLSCVFQCATASTCSTANPNLAFPNNATQLCEPCSVVGCKRCASKDTCGECFDNFWPEFGGRVCVYVWDDRAKNGVNAAFAFSLLLILILLAGVYLIDRCNCFGRCLPQEIESSPDELDDEEDELVRAQNESSLPKDQPGQDQERLDCEITPLSINQGKLHRLRCKVKNLEPRSTQNQGMKHSQSLLGHMERQLPAQNRASTLLGRFKNVPFRVNLHQKFLVGVGLPLFHQWHGFLTLYSSVMCAGTAWIYLRSELSGQLMRTGLDHASHLLWEEIDGKHGAMTLCGLNSQQNHLGSAAQDFARRAALGFFLLWLLGLLLSFWHALRQKRVAQNFHRRHPSLAEFALNLEGFPASATDEEQILQFVRQAFGLEDVQVSVCYDYRDRRERVRELWEKVLVDEDVAAGAYHPNLAGSVIGRRGLGLSEEERDEVRRWLDRSKPGGLKNAGSVFVIFSHNYDLHTAERQFPEPTAMQRLTRGKTPLLPHSLTPEFLLSPLHWVDDEGQMHRLTVRDVACEPPEVAWEHLGLDVASVSVRAALAGLAVLVSFGVIAAVVFLPLATYNISYVSQAGSLPTGVMMSVMGILVMTVNWMIGLLHIFVSSKVGFTRRDREGLLIFKAFSTLCFFSFLFNVAITIFPESSAHPMRFLLHPFGEGRAITSMQDISFQVRASVHLFHVLVPGSLFIGYLLFPLQGFVWPAVSTMSFLRFWHSRSFTADLRAREAEKAMEPLGMSLGHDYMGFVVQPLSCSLTLFFASGVAWQTFGCLALWSLFMMPFTRYMHLRAMRRSYFSTNRIDMDALFAWGFPHSQVLAASAFWAARIYSWSLLVVPLAWLAGLAVYHVMLALVVQPLVLPKDCCDSSRPSYDEVRTRRFYDWHNCNPVKVLLSHCVGSKPIPPFEIGKEYLQENCLEWKERAEKLRARGGGLWSLPSEQVDSEICPLMVPEVEDLLQRPVDWIGQASRSFAQSSPGQASVPD